MPGEQDQEAFYSQLTSNLEVYTTPLEGSWPRTRLCRKQAGPCRSTLAASSLTSVPPTHESDGIWSMGCMSEQELKKRSRKRTSNNRTTTGFRISDELWAVLQPLLPIPLNTHRFGGGRPRVPDRRCADAIFYVLRTGCQWQALDQTELCAHSTAHDRFQEWVQACVFLKLWQAGLEQFEETCGIDWLWLSMDGAMTKAPLGGEKTGPNPTDRGKSGVKRSLLTEGHGVPIGLTIEGANRHDMRTAASDDREHHHQASRADRGPPARDVSGQRV